MHFKVDMDEPLLFFLSVEMKNDNGIDVESLVKIASSAIAGKAKYKFRVRFDVISLYCTIQIKRMKYGQEICSVYNTNYKVAFNTCCRVNSRSKILNRVI